MAVIVGVQNKDSFISMLRDERVVNNVGYTEYELGVLGRIVSVLEEDFSRCMLMLKLTQYKKDRGQKVRNDVYKSWETWDE